MATVQEIARSTVEAVEFRWKQQSPAGGIKPEVAAAEFQKIYREQHGITPEEVVRRASDENHVLHAGFEWDDTIAGPAYRDAQARLMMRVLQIVYRRPNGEMTTPTRYLVKLTHGESDPALDDETEAATAPHVYLPVRVVMEEATWRSRYVRQAYQDLVNWRRRYHDVEELAIIFAQIDALAEKFTAA